jgi:phosphatidylglycerophosphatase A
VGHLTPGPGTWGSAAALPLAWLLHAVGGPLLLAAATVATLFLGLRAVTRLGETGEEMDRPEIVIDEVVGQWIALAPVSVGAAAAGAPVLALWPGILGAFLAFRLFDIWKPWPVSAFDRRKDAWGVMADDIAAGLYAAIAVSAAAALAHGVFLV